MYIRIDISKAYETGYCPHQIISATTLLWPFQFFEGELLLSLEIIRAAYLSTTVCRRFCMFHKHIWIYLHLKLFTNSIDFDDLQQTDKSVW